MPRYSIISTFQAFSSDLLRHTCNEALIEVNMQFSRLYIIILVSNYHVRETERQVQLHV